MDARSSDHLGAGPLFPPVVGMRRLPRMTGREAALEVEIRRPGEMRDIVDPWRRLARNPLEPNLFADPDYLLPALQHLPAGRQSFVVCVWQGQAQGGILRGLVPVVGGRSFMASRDLRVWQPAFADAGACLLARETAEEAIEAVLADLAGRGTGAGLLFPQLAPDGPTAAVLRAVARRTQRRLDVLEPPEAPATVFSVPDPAATAQAQRSFGGQEDVRIERARDPRAVRNAVEEFLALQASGEGDRALIRDVGTASFIRTMTRQMAKSRHCRVDVVRVGGMPVAATILLKQEKCIWPCAAAGDRRRADASALGPPPGRARARDLRIAVRPGPHATFPARAGHRMGLGIRALAQHVLEAWTKKRAFTP
jgi:hypothetical protein